MKNHILKRVQISFTFIMFLFGAIQVIYSQNSKPNIVIIYADDMGYGDLNCQNPDSKIPTPNLDQLASEGMRFTDAHSSSGICSPSRLALLTGMYHWRRQHKIVNSFGGPMFRDSDVTIANMLKTKGYKTAAIGKWHLGWDWKVKNKPTGEIIQRGKKRKFYKSEDIDWSNSIKGGPLDRGFDYYFGDGTINFPPYAWVENENFVELPTEIMNPNGIAFKTKEGAWEFRPGPKVKGWNPYEVLPTLTKKSVAYIENQNEAEPFFLYMALPSPHAPIIPNDEFIGKSEAGAYGDFMFQTDWVVGQILNALKSKGLDENTLVIFSADNGPEKYAFARAEKFNHFSMGDFRGLKRDVWEGGHHVPFIVKWPNHVAKGSVSNVLVSQVDLMSTLADITSANIEEKVAPDSKSFLSVLKNENLKEHRKVVVHNTFKDVWGLRDGKWLYINKKTGEHSKMPDSFKKLRGYTDFETDHLLFDMEKDPEQLVNLSTQYPNKIVKMKILLQKELDKGYLNK